METTLDGLLNRRIMLEQPAKGFRVAVDTIFLASAVPARAGQGVLELGCGVGGAMLALACRVPEISITGLEIQEDLVRLGAGNIARNVIKDCAKFPKKQRRHPREGGDPSPEDDVGTKVLDGFTCVTSGRWIPACAGMTPPFLEDLLSQKMIRADLKILRGDATQLPPAFSNAFDHVMMNPPFHDSARHDKSAHEGKRLANTDEDGDLPRWIASAAQALNTDGCLTLIHRADRLEEIVGLLKPLFGAIHIKPLAPKAGQPAKRVIVRAEKAPAAAPVTYPALVLHNSDGSYTAEAEGVLRHVGALPF